MKRLALAHLVLGLICIQVSILVVPDDGSRRELVQELSTQRRHMKRTCWDVFPVSYHFSPCPWSSAARWWTPWFGAVSRSGFQRGWPATGSTQGIHDLQAKIIEPRSPRRGWVGLGGVTVCRGLERPAHLSAVWHEAVDQCVAVAEQRVQLLGGLNRGGRRRVELLPLHRHRTAARSRHPLHLMRHLPTKGDACERGHVTRQGRLKAGRLTFSAQVCFVFASKNSKAPPPAWASVLSMWRLAVGLRDQRGTVRNAEAEPGPNGATQT